MKIHRRLTIAVILVAPLFLFAARCIENDSLRRGPDGDWHIYGEIHNETDIQGVDILVRGTLFDNAGNVLATGQTGICPGELSPGEFSAYDIGFNNSEGIPQPASYKINVLSGRTMTERLPDLDVDVTDLAASRNGDVVTVTGSIRANQAYSGDFSGCAAFYDGAGNVVQHLTIIGFGPLAEDYDQELELPMPLTPADATGVRLWYIGPGDAPFDSNFKAFTSDIIPID